MDVVPLLSEDDHTVCSTWIRQRIAEGDMTDAAEALGRPFSVEGVVTHGAGRGGRALGFPTANLYFRISTRCLPMGYTPVTWRSCRTTRSCPTRG